MGDFKNEEYRRDYRQPRKTSVKRIKNDYNGIGETFNYTARQISQIRGHAMSWERMYNKNYQCPKCGQYGSCWTLYG